MPRNKRKQRKQSRRARAALALLLAVCIIVGAIVLAVGNRSDIDSVTFCPRKENFPRTAVLIDASDTISNRQAKEVIESIDELFSKQLAQHEWVGIYVLSENEIVLPKPKFHICNPGSRDSANPLYQNPAEFERRYNQYFDRLTKEIEQVVDVPEQDSSPIFEMVYGVAVSNNFITREPRRLLIVSDMLHNTKNYSHYRETPDFDEFLRSNSGQPYLEPALLRGVDVQVLYVKRSKVRNLQTMRHISFWQDYFNHVGARLSRVTPI